MEFDESRLVIDITLMWGDDSNDVGGSLTPKNSSVLSSERVSEFVLKTSLSSPVPFGHFIYTDNRQYGDLVNLVDVPLVYASVSVCMKDGPSASNMSDVYHDEFFNETCVITGIRVVDDSDKNTISFKIDFELADYIKFISNLIPYSTYSKSSDTETSDKVIMSLFGSAGLGNKLDQSTLTIKSPISFITTENATLSSSLRYVYRDILRENFSDTEEKSFVKIRYNYTKHKYELWKLMDFGTNAGLDTSISNEIYAQDVNFVNADIGDKNSNNSDRVVLLSDMNESLILQLCGNKTLYGFDYGKSAFEITEHKNPETTFLTQSDSEFNGKTYKKFSTLKGNSLFDKDLIFKDSLTNSSVDGGIYDMIDSVVMHSRYVNASSDVTLRRKAGDTIFVDLQNSSNTDFMFLNGVYLITESIHKFKRSDKSKGGKPTFMTHVNLFTPYSHENSTKINKSV